MLMVMMVAWWLWWSAFTVSFFQRAMHDEDCMDLILPFFNIKELILSTSKLKWAHNFLCFFTEMLNVFAGRMSDLGSLISLFSSWVPMPE